MGRIAILPDAVADQIAAGEVVERPGSVVKELVENALDAGATTVTIELEAGGRTRITVADDGSGMTRDEAVLAMDRHATSKVRQASDLVGIATYGFRGEALPAIASVSRFEMETAVPDPNAPATRVTVDAGRLIGVDDAARQPGTTVSVRRLFHNAPARRKFLRSQTSETRAVAQAVTVLALARLDVAFRLMSDGRVLLDAPSVSNPMDRIAAIFGRAFAETLIPLDYQAGNLSLHGYVQRPADARPAGRRAFLFVNGRPFRDPFLVRAAEAGYRATINPGCRPSVFVSIVVPGEGVDVNVHPAKLEVRFRDRYVIERAIEDGVHAALGGIASAAVVQRPWHPADRYQSSWLGRRERADQSDLVGELFAVPQGIEPATPTATFEQLLQVFNTYIVVETPEGLSFIDQHSAHERVIYESAIQSLRGNGATAQRLLIPLTLDFEPDECQAIERYRQDLHAIGFEVEPFGGRSVILHAVPNPHPRFDARRCFEEVVADLARGRFGGWANRLERFAATFACRAAVKAGQALDRDEMRALLKQLFACELPPHDVHGRPTIVQLPQVELERRFGRS